MYSLSIPVAALRTKMRQEFERHKFVNNLYVVDMLLFHSHSEYQVGILIFDITPVEATKTSSGYQYEPDGHEM